jgi:hypothetical protein
VSSSAATMDLQIGSAETDFSASGAWSKSYVKRPDSLWRVPRYALIAGVVLAIATSPTTAVPDFWFLERRRRDASTVARVLDGVIGRPVSRAEALRIARSILDRAERERTQRAEWEAERGVQWEEGG